MTNVGIVSRGDYGVGYHSKHGIAQAVARVWDKLALAQC